MTEFRPAVPLRPIRGPANRSGDWCLVDTGSPNTFLDWELAPEAGVDLEAAEEIPNPGEWAIGGAPAEALWAAVVELIIPHDQYMIRLGDVTVIFVKPWLQPGFRAVLGTGGMKRIRLAVDAGASDGELIVIQR